MAHDSLRPAATRRQQPAHLLPATPILSRHHGAGHRRDRAPTQRLLKADDQAARSAQTVHADVAVHRGGSAVLCAPQHVRAGAGRLFRAEIR